MSWKCLSNSNKKKVKLDNVGALSIQYFWQYCTLLWLNAMNAFIDGSIFYFCALLFPHVLNSTYKFSFSWWELLDCPVAERLESKSQSTHRVAMPLSGVHFIMMEKSAQPGEGGVYAHPLLLYLPSCTKLWCTLHLRGQIHSPCFYSTPICTLWSNCLHKSCNRPEPVFLNVYGAQESIPRNEFRQPM